MTRSIVRLLVFVLVAALGVSLGKTPGSTQKIVVPLQPYRKVCYETSVEHVGYTCEGRGACSSRTYPCMDKYELYRHTYSCQLVDNYGNVYRSWIEELETERPNGCCNICVMDYKQALSAPIKLLACGL